MQDENVGRQRENEAIKSIIENLAVQLEQQKQLTVAVQNKTRTSYSAQTANSLSDTPEKTVHKKHKYHHSHKNKKKMRKK